MDTGQVCDDTMDDSFTELANRVLGRKIIHAEHGEHERDSHYRHAGLIITLDDGSRFMVEDSGDCCAYTSLGKFAFNKVDNAVTELETDGDYTKWRVIADGRDVLTMDVDWSEGSGYYMYGFEFRTLPAAI